MAKDASSRQHLNQRIKELEYQEAIQMVELKNSVQAFKHSMAPSALVASAYNGIRENKQVQENIIDRTAGVAVGWVVRKLLARSAGGIITRLSGYALQYVATKIITKKMPALREKMHLPGLLK